MALIELKVPDIGDFKDVEIIEVLVKPGDTVAADQSLITIESDKASMEIPSSGAGTIRELKVKVGDKVNEGSVIATAEGGDATGAAAAPAPTDVPSEATPAPEAAAKSAAPPAAAAPPTSAVAAESDRDQGARHRGLQGRRGDRGARQGRRHDRRGPVGHHDRERQGVDGDPVVGRRRRQGAEGQGRRQGEPGRCPRRARGRRFRVVGAGRTGCRAGRARSRIAEGTVEGSTFCRGAGPGRHARPCTRGRRPDARACEPVGAQVRPRARRRPQSPEGQRTEGPHHAAGRAGLRQGGSRGWRTEGSGSAGRHG